MWSSVTNPGVNDVCIRIAESFNLQDAFCKLAAGHCRVGNEPPAQSLAKEGDEVGISYASPGEVGKSHSIFPWFDVPFQRADEH